MRLTLRTLLAYLDDILDPEDHADIGAKIAESEFATELVQRTRDVVRRMRLGAPQLTGRGMGLDPNTVAEYLDNTLPPERVADFEKVCLESDVHLAEVAACHQILTLVLGEPAHVEPASRERMYQIPSLAKDHQQGRQTTHGAEAAASAAGTTGLSETYDDDTSHKRHKPEVPDYLRESQRSSRKRRVVAVLAALLLIGGITYLALAPPPFVARLMHPPEPAPAPKEVQQAEKAMPELAPPEVSMGDAVGLTLPGEPAEAPAIPPEESTAPPAEIEPAPEAPLPGGKNAAQLKHPASVAGPGAEAAEPGKGAAEPGKLGAAPAQPRKPLVVDNDANLPPFPDVPQQPAGPAEGKEPGGNAGPLQPVGVYSSPMSVLLRVDKESGTWQRVNSGAALVAGDQILALPTYRPAITLSSGMSLELAGGTSIILMQPDARDIPGIELQYGAVILTAPADRLVRLRLGEEQRVVGLSAASRLAVELRRIHIPGADPEATAAPVETDLYAVSGRVQWDVEGKAVDVQAPAHWQLGGDASQPGGKAGDLPAWITSDGLSASDRRASQTLREALSADRPVGLVVSEQVDSRREEVRSLASLVSIYLGRFEPFVTALNDKYQRPSWNAHIDSLRTALALSPAVAASIREAFERKRGEEDGRALYRMLWGYSAVDLKEGNAEKLVDYLEHEQLDFRVLAIWNLKSITGLGLYYQPEQSAAQRQKSVRAWRDRLAAGEIIPFRPEKEASSAKPAAELQQPPPVPRPAQGDTIPDAPEPPK